MTKLELIRKLLEFGDTLNDRVEVRILTRDEYGCVVTERVAPIVSLCNMTSHTGINVDATAISDEIVLRSILSQSGEQQ